MLLAALNQHHVGAATHAVEHATEPAPPIDRVLELNSNFASFEALKMRQREQRPVEPRRRNFKRVVPVDRVLYIENSAYLVAHSRTIFHPDAILRIDVDSQNTSCPGRRVLHPHKLVPKRFDRRFEQATQGRSPAAQRALRRLRCRSRIRLPLLQGVPLNEPVGSPSWYGFRRAFGAMPSLRAQNHTKKSGPKAHLSSLARQAAGYSSFFTRKLHRCERNRGNAVGQVGRCDRPWAVKYAGPALRESIRDVGAEQLGALTEPARARMDSLVGGRWVSGRPDKLAGNGVKTVVDDDDDTYRRISIDFPPRILRGFRIAR